MRWLVALLLVVAHGVAGAQVRVIDIEGRRLRLEVNKGPGNFSARDFEIVIDEGDNSAVRVKATHARTLDEDPDASLALVVLVETTTQFLSQVETPSGSGSGHPLGFNALEDVNRAIKTLSTAGPRGRRTLVSIIPFAPTALPEAFAYAGDLPEEPITLKSEPVMSSSLEQGFTKALELFASQPRQTRRVIVVLGDGESMISDSLRQSWLSNSGIEVHAIELVPPTRIPAVRTAQPALRYGTFRPYGLTLWGSRAADVANLADAIRAHIASSRVLDFTLPDPVLDGNEHEVKLLYTGTAVAGPALEITFPRSESVPVTSSGTSVAPIFALIIVGVIIVIGGVIALVVHLRRRQQPVVAIATPIFSPRQPTMVLPDSPRTRIMRPAGLSAWFVEMINDVPRRTLVLDLNGTTIIGRGKEAHIRFAHDEFMSEKHAQVECIGSAFTLKNHSKTGKTKVSFGSSNEALEIERIELEDNARIEIGTTRLIFKCVKP